MQLVKTYNIDNWRRRWAEMNTGLLHKWSIASACLAILLVVALILNLAFGEETTEEDVIGEPLDVATKTQFQGTHLNFIAETGRIVVNEDGTREIIWDPPQLPTVEESIGMAAAAEEAGDTSLLLLCTQEYHHYLRKQKESGDRTTMSKSPSFPACKGIPDRIILGPPSLQVRRSS